MYLWYILVDRKPKAVGLKEYVRWALEMQGPPFPLFFTRYVKEGRLCHISTVFLPVNHNFRREGLPILFETMIFGGSQSGNQWRYSSWEQARDGHKKAEKIFLDDGWTINPVIYEEEEKMS